MNGFFSSFTIAPRSPEGAAELPALDLKTDLKKERDMEMKPQNDFDTLRMAQVEDKDNNERRGEGSTESSSSSNRISTKTVSDDNDNNNPRFELDIEQLLDTRRELAITENRLVESERRQNEMEDSLSCGLSSAKTIIDDSYADNDEDDTLVRTKRYSIESTLSGNEEGYEVGEATEGGMDEADGVEERDDEKLLLMKEKTQMAAEIQVMQDAINGSTRALLEDKIQPTDELSALRCHYEEKMKRLTDYNEMMMDELDVLHNSLHNDQKTALAATKENEQLKEELKLLHEELSLTNLMSVPSSSSVIVKDVMERVKFLRCDIFSIIKKNEELQQQVVSLRTDNYQLQESLLSTEKERDEKSAAEKKGWLSLNACKRELSRVKQQLQRAYQERDVMKRRQSSLECELDTVRKELRQTRKHHIKNNKMVKNLISDMKKGWW